ncbi:MAG: hypothetical protein J6I68_04375 [Butyrivibrio sp.]|uniref:hypothetical protein n=1 Tax=Butyrivibrio sp. TaxID=28121 RepID=UPI001B60385F|nr:hypothetical protein [Butyrivibrio sp.]MBP3782464.1 hypothetical protein [Butyrivibrio sp.]MBP3813236.1 hypothetical protein [Butyrivibrio sp.]
MRELIELLRDGHARTTKLLAIELQTSEEDVKRQIEYLTNIGVIKKVDMSCGCGGSCGTSGGCGSCSGASGSGSCNSCSSCLPDGGFKNMGEMYEVV